MNRLLATLFVSVFAFILFPLAAHATVEPWRYQGDIELTNSEGIPLSQASTIELSNGQLVIAGGEYYQKDRDYEDPRKLSNNVYFLERSGESSRFNIVNTAQMPKGVVRPNLHEINGVLYIFGGGDEDHYYWIQPDIYRFDEATNNFVYDSDLEDVYLSYAHYFQAGSKVYRIVYKHYDFGDQEYSEGLAILAEYRVGEGWEIHALDDLVDQFQIFAQTMQGESLYFFGSTGRTADSFLKHAYKLNVNTRKITPLEIPINKDYLYALPMKDGTIHLYFEDFSYGPPYGYDLDIFYPDTEQLVERSQIRSRYSLSQYAPDWNNGQSDGYMYSPTSIFGNNSVGGIYKYEYSDIEYVTDSIETLYWEVLYRSSDPGGLAYWTEQYQNGVSIEEIHEAFATSPERREKVLRRDARLIYIETLTKWPNEEQIDYLAWLLENGRSKQSIVDELLSGF